MIKDLKFTMTIYIVFILLILSSFFATFFTTDHDFNQDVVVHGVVGTFIMYVAGGAVIVISVGLLFMLSVMFALHFSEQEVEVAEVWQKV